MPFRSVLRRTLPSLVMLASLAATAAGVGSAGALLSRSRSLTTGSIRVFHGFHDPEGLALVGNDLWVGNDTANSLTEILATTGHTVRVVRGSSYKFASPCAIAATGSDLWVSSCFGSEITEIRIETGALVRTITSYKLNDVEKFEFDGTYLWSKGESLDAIAPATGAITKYLSNEPFRSVYGGMTYAAHHLWVTNAGEGTVTEVSTPTGAILRTVRIPNLPNSPAVSGPYLWVTCTYHTPGDLLQLSQATGKVIRTVTAGPIRTDIYGPIASSGSTIWVGGTSSVSAINGNTGQLIASFSPGGGFSDPLSIVAQGNRAWVADGDNDTVTELTI